jgi:hypothetical protein
MDATILPALIWSIALAVFRMFSFLSTLGLLFGIPALAFMWQVVYIWISYVSEKSGNKNLRKKFDDFIYAVLAPVRAIVNLWNAIVNGLSTWFRVVSENWNNMIKVYTDTVNLVSNSFKFLSEQAAKLWTEIVITFKALWDQSIKLLQLIVSMGGTIDEDIAPPLPEQFEKSEYPQSSSPQVSVAQTVEQQAASVISSLGSFFR